MKFLFYGGQTMYYAGYGERFKDQMQFVQDFYEKRIYRPIINITDVSVFETKDHLRKPPADGYKVLSVGSLWGEEWGNAWFRFSFTVPDDAAGQAIYVVPHTDAVETLCFVGGKPAGIIKSKNLVLSLFINISSLIA